MIDRPIITNNDLKEFIDKDLGSRIRSWKEYKAAADGGDIYLATNFNLRQGVITELAVDYLQNTSVKNMMKQFEDKKEPGMYRVYLIIEVQRRNDDSAFNTPVKKKVSSKKGRASGFRSLDETSIKIEGSVKQEPLSSPNLTEEEKTFPSYLGLGEIKVCTVISSIVQLLLLISCRAKQ